MRPRLDAVENVSGHKRQPMQRPSFNEAAAKRRGKQYCSGGPSTNVPMLQ